jgi:hypothetical protein
LTDFGGCTDLVIGSGNYFKRKMSKKYMTHGNCLPKDEENLE